MTGMTYGQDSDALLQELVRLAYETSAAVAGAAETGMASDADALTTNRLLPQPEYHPLRLLPSPNMHSHAEV